MSTIIDSYLNGCWRWAVGHTGLIKDAHRRVETVPALVLCETCKKTCGNPLILRPAYLLPLR